MSYQPENIKVHGDAITMIRQTPQIFFRNGIPNGLDLLQHLLTDVTIASVFDVRAKREGDLFCLSASADWMRLPPGAKSIDYLFQHIVSRPELANACRGEVFLTAVADGCFTVGRGGSYYDRLSEDDLPRHMRAMMDGAERFLAWRFTGPYA